jgi:hypothetical protein
MNETLLSLTIKRAPWVANRTYLTIITHSRKAILKDTEAMSTTTTRIAVTESTPITLTIAYDKEIHQQVWVASETEKWE